MKAINKTAAGIFQAAIDRIPAGRDADGQTSVCLDAGDQAHGGAIMALHVECIGANKYGKLYSFAHYYEQNGDLMRDPDVVMLKNNGTWAPNGGIFFPLSYRQDGLGMYREYVVFNEDGNGWKIAQRAQADLCSFCNGWALNLKEQQGLKAAKRESVPVLHCSGDVAEWLDPSGGLQKAGLMKADKGRPEPGKMYSLTGAVASIANGNTWAESEVKQA